MKTYKVIGGYTVYEQYEINVEAKDNKEAIAKAEKIPVEKWDELQSQNIDCGFTNGARFILIKRKTGGSGDWYVFDTARGIVSGNDPYLLLNSTAAQNGNYDAIDPLSSGFTLASGSSYIDGLNASGSTYLFFAIA